MKQLTVTTIARTFLAAAAFAVLAIPAASRAAGTLKSVGCAAEFWAPVQQLQATG